MSATGTTVPFVVLGGYLGSGKTTLINQLLSEPNAPRCGVLVNDFGAINVDEELIANRSGETIALTNGCACCRIQDDLGPGIDELLGLGQPFDVLLVEASGVAHPEKIAGFGATWPGLRPGGTGVVVDALRLPELRRDKFVGKLVEHQIRVADLVLLSKRDLATKGQIEAAGQTVGALGAALCPEARPEDWLVSVQRAAGTFATRLSGLAYERAFGPKEQFFSRTLSLEPLDLSVWVPALEQATRSLDRLKGFVVDTNGQRHEVQGTRSGLELRAAGPAAVDGETYLVLLSARGSAELDEAEALLSRTSGVSPTGAAL